MRYLVEWRAADTLRVVDPTMAEVAAAADTLAAYYNEPYNRGMMAHEAEMTAAEVVEHFARLRGEGGRPVLLERDGLLVGDADLRRIVPPTAEFAIMVGVRSAQGQGLGLRFAVMAHALAFGPLGLERVYCSIIPANAASRRMFEKLGYLPDDSPAARAYADEADDVTLSLAASRFRELHAAALPALHVAPRADVEETR
ncbi:MAG TPA: GNAT family N-acetyltransferase [Polyangia bacterium]|jgi:RimJ/RimL family protein N-acetyltransferase